MSGGILKRMRSNDNKKNSSKYYSLNYYVERDYKDLDPYLKYLLLNWAVNNRNRSKETIRILDVGCGIGVYIKFFKNQGYTVYGIDYSSAAVKISEQIQSSALYLPFRDNSFDLIISAHLIEHLTPEEVKRYLKEIMRVLKNSGRIFLLTPNMWSFRRLINKNNWFNDPSHINMFSPKKMRKVLNQNHFIDVKFHFRIPLFLQRNASKKWIMPYSGPFRLIKKYPFLQDMLFFLFTSTPMAYFRDVIYVLARKGK